MRNKLTRAMGRPGRELLEGPGKADETHMGGPEEGFRGRETQNRAVVVVAPETRGKAIWQIRLRRVAEVCAESLIRHACGVAASDTVVRTDGWGGYTGLAYKGYGHQVVRRSPKHRQPCELLPSTHRAASPLKRWLQRTHGGAVSRGHLAYYLDEFAFRLNHRTSPSRRMLFHRLVRQAMATDPLPYGALVGAG
ncbi:MAG: IS1595 family transposase [Planctomycetota bacterium]